MKLFAIILLFSSIIYSFPISLNTIDQKIIDYSFNEEFDEAKKLSREQIYEYPNSPKYYYYYINTTMLEYSQKVRELNSENRDEGRKKINKELVDYCQKVLDKFGDSKFQTEEKFYYGAIYGYLARANGLDGSWWGAFTAGKKAKSIMQEIITEDPDFYDAYLLLGMLEYYSDRLSGITSLVASVLGFSGDREKGLRYLELAYNKGSLTFGQTALTLIEVYAHLEDNEIASIKYYRKFLERFPKNKRIYNAYCHELMNLLDFTSVENIINNDSNNLIKDYTKARFYHTRAQSDLAIKFAENALADKHNLWRGVAEYSQYIIVFNNWLLGNKAKAKQLEILLSDKYKEIFSTVIKNENEAKWLHRFTIEISLGKSVLDIEKFIKTRPAFKSNVELESQFFSLLGSYYMKTNFLNKAEEAFYNCLKNEDSSVRYSAFKGLIDIYMNINVAKSKVKNLIDMLEDFDNDRLIYRSQDLEKKYRL
ncbi:MAG: hypothetical protein CVV23_07575 [Ignavibacteriae bacterium HGW-Ignavibacteriae-2]|jgi:tetratricopeptide (TPR) repeat protein|nr:MAG: hypothetical protein CVV23_07575 [Ignavibacteriae bacterium HGW-Ignavibacteriae-2]